MNFHQTKFQQLYLIQLSMDSKTASLHSGAINPLDGLPFL